jgi:hypothetical protein
MKIAASLKRDLFHERARCLDQAAAVGLILNEIWESKMEIPGKMDAG